MNSPALGIDIGGSGIKFGLVDIEQGKLIEERIKVDTPQPSTPDAICTVIRDVVSTLDWHGNKIGVGFPAVIIDGVSLTATNIDNSWIGVNVEDLLHKATGHTYFVGNDADGAGLSECMYGRIKGVKGTVLMLTIGTGIGSALFYDGILLPNTEFGHIQFKGDLAEHWVSNRARKERVLEYDDWAKELAEFLDYMILLFSPKLIVLGGGVSFKFDLYKHHFADLRAPIVNATAFNDAGIIGAALLAYPELMKPFT